jgi:hypothetical protein
MIELSRELYEAITNSPDGVLPWSKRWRWTTAGSRFVELWNVAL